MKLKLKSLYYVFSLTSLVFFINTSLLANSPPGLEKKGMDIPPSFLGKTPPGWNEGLKKGWNKNKDWRWNKHTHMWENKHWRWNSKTKNWNHTKGWEKHL